MSENGRKRPKEYNDRYDEECRTIINWADASDVRHVDITFSCKDFNEI